MKKTIILLLALMTFKVSAVEMSKIKPVKNVIFMIADGTSLPALSVTRYVNWYNNPDQEKLALDEILCGTVRTNCINAPIGDSAPTGATYMTGHSAPAGYISTYSPDFGKDNFEKVDVTKTNGPAATIMEACKQVKGKSTGLVVTVNFNHATPSDCFSHYYNRNETAILASQIVNNNVDVVIASGNKYLTPELENYLEKRNYSVIRDDIQAMRSCTNNKMWALFRSKIFDYEIDCDKSKQPSLAEMTKLALDKLSQNKKGFFVMVEGSQIDFAAHNNDPAGIVSETLAFDKAVKVALDFAKKDKNTAVVILSDHGNSGITIGKYGLKGYSSIPMRKMFGPIADYKLSAEGMLKKLNSRPGSDAKRIFKKYANIDLSEQELEKLYRCKGYKNSIYPEKERNNKIDGALYTSSFSRCIASIMVDHCNLGFSTSGHSGEDVFLGCYNPNGAEQLPIGMNTNVEINQYLCALCGMYNKLDEFSDNIYAHSDKVFNGYKVTIDKTNKKFPVLNVENSENGKSFSIKAHTNVLYIKDGKNTIVDLPSVVIYVDKTDLFYVPKNITEYLK